MARKYQEIDILKMYAQSNADEVESLLSKYESRNDLESLRKMIYGLQSGMDALVRKKLQTDEIIIWFVGMERLIERTAKRIFRRAYPSPMDFVLGNANKKATLTDREAKRLRQKALSNFIRESSF